MPGILLYVVKVCVNTIIVHGLFVFFLHWFNQFQQTIFSCFEIMHDFKIGLIFVKDFLIQTYILAVFKGETLKVILFSKLNRFLRSMTQGSIRTDKKMDYNYITRLKFCFSLYPLLILTCTPFQELIFI